MATATMAGGRSDFRQPTFQPLHRRSGSCSISPGWFDPRSLRLKYSAGLALRTGLSRALVDGPSWLETAGLPKAEPCVVFPKLAPSESLLPSGGQDLGWAGGLGVPTACHPVGPPTLSPATV